MDQEKIGKFIAAKRKEQKITQEQLAEMLGITDRAISKWENGHCLPDAGTMIPLCNILKISVNDLFSGEVVKMEDYKKVADENLVKLKELEERENKLKIKIEFILFIISIISLLSSSMIPAFSNMEDIFVIISVTIGIFIFGISFCVMIYLDYNSGYFKCKECGHIFKPKFIKYINATHVFSKRKLKCPECNKNSYCKHVLTK